MTKNLKKMFRIILVPIFFITYIVNAHALEYNVVDFTSSNLPIIKIDTKGNLIDVDQRIVAKMEIIYNDNIERNYLTDSANNYNGLIEIEYHGQSSLMFPKKSYRIETQDSLGENRNESLLGMPKENDWILYAPYSDKTLIRNVLTYTLASEIGQYAPRIRFCELFLNDEYQGVYILTEKIKRDKNRIDVVKMLPGDIDEPAVSGGYIFKKDKTNPGDNIIWLSRGLDLIITEPKNDIIAVEQTEWLINYLNHFEDELYASGNYTEYIDVLSFVDNLLIVELARNIDGYRLSTYFHKDRNSKIVAAPVWDYNLSFGNADYFNGWDPEGWQYSVLNIWDKNWWIELLNDSEFNELCASRWDDLRINQFEKTHIFSMIDEWVLLLEEAQERNFKKYPILAEYVWPNPGFPQSGSFSYDCPKSGGPTTYEEEINCLKDFIEKRLEWLDAQFELVSGLQNDDLCQPLICILHQNFPNPFNPLTRINYSISKESHVSLAIYDSSGREVATIINKNQMAGEHSIMFNANQLTSGIYFYKLKTGCFEQSRKMLLLK